MARRMAFALGPISIVSWYFAFILGSLPASTPLAFHVSRSTFSLSSLPDDWTPAEHRLSKVPLPWTNLLTYARRSRSSSPPLLPILTFLRPAHCRWCPRFCIISGASAKGAPGSDTSCSDPSPCCSTACSTSLDSVSSSLGWECCLRGRCGVCEVSVPARENRRCFILFFASSYWRARSHPGASGVFHPNIAPSSTSLNPDGFKFVYFRCDVRFGLTPCLGRFWDRFFARLVHRNGGTGSLAPYDFPRWVPPFRSFTPQAWVMPHRTIKAFQGPALMSRLLRGSLLILGFLL